VQSIRRCYMPMTGFWCGCQDEFMKLVKCAVPTLIANIRTITTAIDIIGAAVTFALQLCFDHFCYFPYLFFYMHGTIGALPLFKTLIFLHAAIFQYHPPPCSSTIRRAHLPLPPRIVKSPSAPSTSTTFVKLIYNSRPEQSSHPRRRA
jgi:hypothetical protein